MSEKNLIEEMRSMVKKHDTKEREKKKQENRPITMKDLEKFLQSPHKIADPNLGSQPMIQAQPIQQQPKELTQQQQIAIHLWKDSKATSIVCLIAIITALAIPLVAMINLMVALIVALFMILYPILIFVKMVQYQTRLHNRYGLKPLFQFQQQPPPMKVKQTANKGKFL